MKKTKSVVVGTGGWAEAHAKAYRDCTDVELAGICGHQNVERLDELAARYGIPERSLDLDTLLSKVQPDMLDIACNPHFRLEGMRAGMAPWIKLINVEKPMALTPGEAYEIERLCLKGSKLLTVNHQKKFLPAWRRAKDAISAGVVGEIYFMRATCQGNLLEQGTHLVDMTLFYNDYCPVRWVMGQVDELQGLQKKGASAPDAALASICFENGVRAIIELGTVGHNVPGETNKWHHFAVEVYGSGGQIKVSLNRTFQMITYADGVTVTDVSSWDKHYISALTQHLDAAARYALDPTTGHISDLSKSMSSFQVIMAIYASGCGGGVVELPQRFGDQLIGTLGQLERIKAWE